MGEVKTIKEAIESISTLSESKMLDMSEIKYLVEMDGIVIPFKNDEELIDFANGIDEAEVEEYDAESIYSTMDNEDFNEGEDYEHRE